MQRSISAMTLVTSLIWSTVGGWAQENQDQAAEGEPKPGAVFQAKLNEWKEILKEMRKIQATYTSVEADEAAEIRRRWPELIAKGESMISELRDAGTKAYVASPGVDRDLERFLVKVLNDDVAHDRYEGAAHTARALLANGCDVKALLSIAGVSAFATNDFDTAEEYLQQAQAAGVLSDTGRNFLGLLPKYKQLWAEEKQLREQEAAETDPEKQLPRVKVTTSVGELVIELFENEAPGAVGNFVNLVEKGFYDGLSFHRVLPGFMAQGGCPLGNGQGGPGYNIACECYEPNHRQHFRGTLSMAHAGRDTGGSQFFLTFVPTDHLNGKHTAFGRVIEGMDVLGKIRRIEPGGTKKEAPDKIVKMEVTRKRPGTEYAPKKVQ